VAKTLSAADMMGRTKSDKATRPLVAVSPRNLETETPSTHGDQSTSGSVDSSPSALDDQSTGRQVNQAPSRPVGVRYEKTSAFVTPEQRQWLKSTARSLPDGLSASDIVRLALERLRDAVEDGLPLVELLTAAAHLEAERFAGRRNRGLPTRPVD